jgi:hypothetical protein
MSSEFKTIFSSSEVLAVLSGAWEAVRMSVGDPYSKFPYVPVSGGSMMKRYKHAVAIVEVRRFAG